MKILWITNAPFPEIYKGTRLEDCAKGWVHSSAHELIRHNMNVSLGVVSLYRGKKLQKFGKKNITHYLLPQKLKDNKTDIKRCLKKIKNEFQPDLVHIHGTEYPYLFSYVNIFGSKNVVVSIQGLISVIDRYYFGGIKKIDLLKSITLRDMVRFNTIFTQHRNLQYRTKYEKLLLRQVKNVIGRTAWDHDHVKEIHPEVRYHLCNETLRPSFYQTRWNIEFCEKYTIFVSQAYYPLKGFHQLIKALPKVLRQFPHTKVYVAGSDFLNKRAWRLNGFGKYINSLIFKYKLTNNIFFTGVLSEKQMCEKFKKSHVFVSPSAIENSSNSIGEAQILGVPVIASYVGGTPDMIEHGKTGLLYRYEEVEMLAANICQLFADNNLAVQLSENSKIAASYRHNKERNVKKLYDIYLNILKQ